jgi:hypothetical protein
MPAASFPPLHRTQERGTHFSFCARDFKGWATRPVGLNGSYHFVKRRWCPFA